MADQKMFKRIEIQLTTPICTCTKEDVKLAWGISRSSDGPGLTIECETCGVELRIPHKRFEARFTFDTPYRSINDPPYSPGPQALTVPTTP